MRYISVPLWIFGIIIFICFLSIGCTDTPSAMSLHNMPSMDSSQNNCATDKKHLQSLQDQRESLQGVTHTIRILQDQELKRLN